MKILVVGDFDPCGVHLGHRKYLRDLGVDYRIAVREAYREDAKQADYWIERPIRKKGEFAEMRWFARDADVIQFLPSIGQPWSFQESETRFGRDADENPFDGIDWSDKDFSKPLKVFFFHGSRNALGSLKEHREYYGRRGPLLASTIDYSYELGAEYIPTIVDFRHEPRYREDAEALRVVHSPTDPSICNSEEFLGLCSGLKIKVTYLTGRSHESVLMNKRSHHAGFDHLRGAFSVNSLENAAFGMVNLVGVKPRYLDLLGSLGISLPWPAIETMGDVGAWLERLRDDPSLTREWQRRASEWVSSEWSPERLAARIVSVYERILGA